MVVVAEYASASVLYPDGGWHKPTPSVRICNARPEACGESTLLCVSGEANDAWGGFVAVAAVHVQCEIAQ
jgi:hypothetical protein